LSAFGLPPFQYFRFFLSVAHRSSHCRNLQNNVTPSQHRMMPTNVDRFSGSFRVDKDYAPAKGSRATYREMSFRLNLFAALVCFQMLMCADRAWAADNRSRFDGIWEGVETLTPIDKLSPEEAKREVPPPHTIAIAIAQGGTSVAVLGGTCPGRYKTVHQNGNTLVFEANDCHLRVTLSSDGKTLQEDGNCNRPRGWLVSGNGVFGVRAVSWIPLRMSGTFHRIK
jgi:hypothetical protein